MGMRNIVIILSLIIYGIDYKELFNDIDEFAFTLL